MKKNNPNNLKMVGAYANHIGRNRQYVYRMIWSGRLPFLKIGGIMFIAENAKIKKIQHC